MFGAGESDNVNCFTIQTLQRSIKLLGSTKRTVLACAPKCSEKATCMMETIKSGIWRLSWQPGLHWDEGVEKPMFG